MVKPAGDMLLSWRLCQAEGGTAYPLEIKSYFLTKEHRGRAHFAPFLRAAAAIAGKIPSAGFTISINDITSVVWAHIEAGFILCLRM